MNTTLLDVPVADTSLEALVDTSDALVLRTLEAAEMIHVGGGYCAADY